MSGVTADGTKELVTLEDGYRESTESWASVLRDLRGRGLRAPAVAVGDGALGLWSAVRDVWPETTVQRDWCTSWPTCSTSCRSGCDRGRSGRYARSWYAPTKADAEKAIGVFVAEFEVKYPKATACLVEDQDALLAFDRIAVRDGPVATVATACDQGGRAPARRSC